MKNYLPLLFVMLIAFEASAQTANVTPAAKSVYASINGHTKGDISIQELSAADGLALVNNQDSVYKISHFHIAIYCKGKDPFEAESNTNLFNESMKGAFKNFASEGCYGYVDLIVCTNGKDTLELPDIAFAFIK